MVYCFDLTELTTLDEANKMADELLEEAIEVSEARRGKRGKILRCESKINQLRKKSLVKKWKEPLSILQKGMQILTEAEAEMESVWSIR